ncbi:protein-tyrosine-phosphatase [Gracilimonas mengyeensis]|uniref:Arsenate reductase n=1 Tax=Gracilimonas mengyeensis TaxID=1302730 RepID=A0A521BKS3_9BACT|nr:protein-tyrosine-phosphatase [Gracilimonas mengyeensis]SMO47692.1 arsenate reductase [Gracilimonas mengyeensis]
MYPKLKTYINEIESTFDSIPSSRREELEEVATYIKSKKEQGETAQLNFICTHNSRRSHLAQIWTATAAHVYGLNDLESYSGGTEATAFNPRAVAALERAGFEVENPGGENPGYKVRCSENEAPMVCFSKKFDHPINPKKQFAAIMTCSDADENCPFVPGAEFRKPVTYRDPKESDGTAQEAETYDERCRQIAAEMFYMIRQAAQ